MLNFRTKRRGSDARGPSAPSKPDTKVAAAGGELAGPRVVGVPLGSIIPRRFADDPTLVVREAPRSPLAERYRSLVHQLFPDHASAEGSRRQIVTITSAAPDEGKTTTALNLALALAERRDHSTLIIDADLRRPSISQYLTPRPKFGLSDILQGEARLEHGLLELKDVKLTILPAGTLVPNPQELLRSQYVSALFADLRKQFDYVVVDTPPVVPFTDASVLNVLSDGGVLVIRAGSTPRPLVERAVGALSQKGLLGIVLNCVQITPVDRYYYKYDEYDPYAYSRNDEKEGE